MNKTEVNKKLDSFRSQLCLGYWVPYVVGTVGLILLLTASVRFFGFSRGASLLLPAATCLAASAAGFVGLRGILTWIDQIRRDRLEKNREAAELYMSAAMMHLGDVKDNPDLQEQLKGRLACVLWGSDSTVQAALVFAGHIAESTNNPDQTWSANDLAFGSLMLSLRKDLVGTTIITAEQLVSVVFVKKLPPQYNWSVLYS